MLGLILGIFVILLGAKAFSASGIPLTKGKNLTGPVAKVIGVVCILLGIALFAGGVFSAIKVFGLMQN